jgi:hypothetical protein
MRDTSNPEYLIRIIPAEGSGQKTSPGFIFFWKP